MTTTSNSTNAASTHLAEGALGFPEALATAVGLIIASSVLLTATQGFGVGGWVFALAIVVAYILMMCQSASFAEAAGILPTSGAVYDYVAAGMGRFWAITGTLAAYMLVHIFAGTAEVSAVGLFAQVNFDFLANLPAESTWIIGTVLVGIFMVVNLLGINVYGRVEVVMTAVMWLTLTLFGLLGVLKATQSGISGYFGESMVGVDVTAVLVMTGLAMFLFVGVEYVTPLAPELKNPHQNIPRAMYLGVTLVAVAMFVYGAGIARQVQNVELEPGVMLFDTPLPIPAFGEAIMGGFGKLWLGIAALLAGTATINTLIAGIPRILYGMAKDGTLPSSFAYLHPRYKTPWIGIFFVAIIPIIGSIWIRGDIGSIIAFILAAVCAWIFGYILVNISVVVLRMKRPDLKRPYKTPLYPLPQIVATVGMLITIWYITPPFLTPDQIYLPFLVMLLVCAGFALIWTYGVQQINPWVRIEPETLIAEEGLTVDD
ncbi:MAG: APC family amino acid permease [Anaerolineae bacterium]|nr:APC family permease [Anaerolineales bacterium]MCQ3976546.1 APC family amino acid permease [Anaerolineae bacterium]